MNMITCNKNCKHQKDGFCALEDLPPLNSIKVGGCSYFSKKESAKREPGADNKPPYL